MQLRMFISCAYTKCMENTVRIVDNRLCFDLNKLTSVYYRRTVVYGSFLFDYTTYDMFRIQVTYTGENING